MMEAGPGVPPTMLLFLLLLLCPAAIADPRVDALASVLRDVTGQLERFNNLYINKLERELSESAAKIAALEATVRSIADRAAAWDNIQNHMTVWTDQSRTMDRKLDILNRCHEKQESWETRLNAVDALNHKLTALDKKINAMTRLEFKVEQVSERVEEVDSTINWVKKQMNSPEHPIITEFAGRGLLSSLIQIENKLDNITQKLSDSEDRSEPAAEPSHYQRPRVLGSRVRQVRPTVEAEPGIIFTTAYDEAGNCNLHPRDARRLQDVSAKVDLVYDRLTDPDYEYDYFVSHLHQRAAPLTAPTDGFYGDNSEEEPSPEHLFARFWKSLFSPFKKMKRRFRGFENQLVAVQRSCNETASMESYLEEMGGELQRKLMPLDRTLREEMEVTRGAVNEQSASIEKVSQALGSTAYVNEQLLAQMTSQFQALHATIQERFDESRNLIYQYCAGGGRRDVDQAPREPSYTPRHEPRLPSSPPPPTPPTTTTTPTPTTQPYAPPYDPTYNQPTSPREENDRNRGQQPGREIRPLHGGRHHRFRTRYKYRVHYPPQNERVRTHGRPVTQALRRKLSQPRRGRKKVPGLFSRNNSRRRGRGRLADPRTARGVPHQLVRESVKDCSDLLREGVSQSTVFNFSPGTPHDLHQGLDFYTRYCDLVTGDGGWTVIQRRGMFGPPFLNFTMDWHSYKNGFGDISREFWWGNDNIYRLIQQQNMMVRFDLWDFDGNYAYAEYLSFSIGNEEEKYRLQVFGYRGNASDSFSAHNGYFFSTLDRDNDEAPECCPCAPAYGGGWWFYSCFESNLNGEYHRDPKDNDYYRGIIWELWLGDYSLRATEIKLRPAHFSNGSPTPYPTPYPTPHPTDTLIPELPLRQQ